MIRSLIFVILFSAPHFSARAQESWREILRRDLVSIQGNYLVFDQTSMCSWSQDNGTVSSFQVRVTSRAPVDGVLSRDRFVAFSSELLWEGLYNVFERLAAIQEHVDAYHLLEMTECRPLRNAIGSVNMAIVAEMTEEGMQVTTTAVDSDIRAQVVYTWAERLGL